MFESILRVDDFMKLIGKFQCFCVFLLKETKAIKNHLKVYVSFLSYMLRISEIVRGPSELSFRECHPCYVYDRTHVRYTDVTKGGYLDSIWTRNPLHLGPRGNHVMRMSRTS